MAATHLTKPRGRASLLVAATTAIGLALSGCTTGLGGQDYGRSAVGVPAEAVNGTVVSVRTVQIEGSRTGLGATGGAVAGGALGSTIGGGTAERVAAGAAGAILGGLAGAAAEQGATQQTGIEYTIELDRGDTIVVVQGDKEPVALAGQPVRVLYGDRVRVAPAYGGTYP